LNAIDPVMAAQWHLTARAIGAPDSWLQDFVARLPVTDRARAEQGARLWLR
jgi:uncharacterized protein